MNFLSGLLARIITHMLPALLKKVAGFFSRLAGRGKLTKRQKKRIEQAKVIEALRAEIKAASKAPVSQRARAAMLKNLKERLKLERDKLDSI